MDGITDSVNMSLSKLWGRMKDREAWCAAVHGVTKSYAYRFLNRQVRWSGIPISQNFPQFVVIYTVKSFGILSKAEVVVFWNFLAFSMIQQMLAI